MSAEFSFFFATALAATLVLITVTLHYEALRLISLILPHLKIQPRLRIMLAMYGIFFTHTLEVWLFGLAYYLLHQQGLGTFGGQHLTHDIFDFVYFSVVVYTSVGFGDVYPIAHLRLLAGVEGLTGLLMIGWSTSFTYLLMEKLWLDHPKRSGSKKQP